MKKIIKKAWVLLIVTAIVLSMFSGIASAAAQDRVVAVAAREHSSFAIRSDGTLWAWGRNVHGQLGDGTTINRTTPVQVLTNVIDVALGDSHTLALRADGTLWAWGLNSSGQLGDGTTTNRHIPVQILTNIISIGAGYWHSFAIRSDRTLWAWGHNNWWQLGNGTQASRSTPFLIMDNAIYAGGTHWHSHAIRANGSLWGWAVNWHGGVGDGTATSRPTPFQIQTLINITSISQGEAHSLAIRNDNTLWAWGGNWDGRIGDGTTIHRLTPVLIMSGINSIAAGLAHNFAVKNDNTLWAWGRNSSGQLGDGTIVQRNIPVQVLTNVYLAAAGASHSLAIRSDGTLWAWGLNNLGQLGDGTATNRLAPIRVNIPLNTSPVSSLTLPATALTNTPVPIACTSTDADGTIASRVWAVTPSTGFTGTLSGTGGTLTFTAPGTYTIRLTVTDNSGGANTSDRIITVTAPNVHPVAGITLPATALTNAPVPITCISTDADGTIASRVWSVTPSTGFTGTLTGAGGTLTFTTPGTYAISLSVTDNSGATNSTSRTITVTAPAANDPSIPAPNIPPAMALTVPAAASPGVPVEITSAASDADGTITNRAWQIIPNTGFTSTLTGTGGTLTFNVPGTYIIRLAVTDNHGIRVTRSRAIIIRGVPPVAAITAPATALTGVPIAIACSSANADGTITNRVWQITPNAGFTGTLTGTGGTLTFNVPGTYIIRLAVTDNHGIRVTRSRAIIINHPTAKTGGL